MRKSSQLKIGSLLAYIQMGLGILIGLLYTPFMTRILGQSEFGLYNTVASTISMLGVLTLGLNSSYIRYYSIYKKNNDCESIYKLNGIFFIVLSFIGLIALGCGLYISEHLSLIFKNGLTPNEYSIARVLMLLLTFNLAISFPMGVFADIILANEKFIFLKLLGMLKTVGGPLVTLPLLLAGYRSIAVVSSTVAISLFTDILYLIYVFRVLHNKFIFHGFQKGLLQSIFTYTSFIAINIVVDQINWNVDKILLGRYKGTAAVAVYSIGFSLYHYYQLFSTSVSSVFTPRIHKIVNNQKDNIEQLRKDLTLLLTKVGRIQFIILGLLASGLVFFGKDFITNIWVGKEYGESYYVMLLLVLPASIALIQNLGIEVQRAQNKHKFRSVAYLAMALINIVMSIYLCQLYGAIGSAFGTAISLILANGLAMNIYYHKACNIDVLFFWKEILSLSKGLVLPIVLEIVIQKYCYQYSIVKFLLHILFYSFVYCVSMFVLGMNHYERGLILNPLKKMFRVYR